MFKGLRTKIESEKGKDNQNLQPAKNVSSGNNDSSSSKTSSNIPTALASVTNEALVGEDSQSSGKSSSSVPPKSVQNQTPNDAKPSWTSGVVVVGDPEIRAAGVLSTNQLREQVASLTKQLEEANREKEIGNEQNAQLYQLIEKLRRNLESEKETNSSLKLKLKQSELALKEKTDLIESLENTASNVNPFAPKDKSNPHVPVTMKDLQMKVNELQTKLSEKNRQLKVSHQTTNDIRKALQQEILEHNKTRETCGQLQIDLKQSKENPPVKVAHNGSHLESDIETHRKNSLAPLSTTSELHDLNRPQHSLLNLDKDDKSLQVDRISLKSKSSASIYDFDPNDLPGSINSKDVNHEYLRNVLFRYMTSNDKETTQHLVKAISVMMNFTPDQRESIKSAMNTRSSWLRLK